MKCCPVQMPVHGTAHAPAGTTCITGAGDKGGVCHNGTHAPALSPAFDLPARPLSYARHPTHPLMYPYAAAKRCISEKLRKKGQCLTCHQWKYWTCVVSVDTVIIRVFDFVFVLKAEVM